MIILIGNSLLGLYTRIRYNGSAEIILVMDTNLYIEMREMSTIHIRNKGVIRNRLRLNDSR